MSKVNNIKESLQEFIIKNKIILGALGVAVIISGAATAGTLAAVDEFDDDDHHEYETECEYKEGRGHRGEFKKEFQEIRDAVEDDDYELWVTLMSEADHVPDLDINEDTFSQLQEIHFLMEDGNKEEARAMMEELGLHPAGQHHGGNRGKHNGELKEIFEAEDYDAWADLMAEFERFEDVDIDYETFELLLEAHELREAGDHDGAKAVLQEVFGEDLQPKHHNKEGDRPGFENQGEGEDNEIRRERKRPGRRW